MPKGKLENLSSDAQQNLVANLRKQRRRIATAAEKVIEVFCLDEFAEKEEEATALQALKDAILEGDA